MKRMDNAAGAVFFPRRRGSVVLEFLRAWAYPVGVLGFWLTIAILSLGQLITVGPALRSIPDVARYQLPPLGAAARPVR